MQTFFERVENFRSPAHRLGETVRADRHHHEFLEIYWVISVLSTIYDIHPWHRQDMGRHTANIAIERQPPAVRRSEEHTSELQSLMRSSYALFCMQQKQQIN